MKSKLLTVFILGLVLTGCSKVPLGNGPSFRTQMCELMQLRDSGVITEQEYHTSKKLIFSTMVH
jgi:hypothetical protein